MNFISVFKQISPARYQHDHKIICSAKQIGRYRVLSSKEATNPITFNQIIDLAKIHLQSATKKELAILENGIRCMADRKIAKTHFDQGLCGTIRAFFARLHNLFLGYGFTTSVDRAKNLLLDIKQRHINLGKEIPLEKRPYTHDGCKEKARIIWTEKTLKSWCVKKYAKSFGMKLDPQRIHVVGKQTHFTYYDEKPEVVSKERQKIVAKYSTDRGWGCAWRGALNVIEKARQWLAKKGISTDPNKQEDRFLDMGDVAEWSNFAPNEWMEPIDAAELFYKFVQSRYAEADQTKILALLKPRGHLYSADDRLKILGQILSRQMGRGGKTKDHEVMPLDTLRSVNWGEAEEDSLKQIMALYHGALPDEANGDHADSIKEVVAILKSQKLDLATYSLEKYCKVAMALVKFYSGDTCHSNDDVTTDECPDLDEELQPFPWMIDDKYTARNIYAYCTNTSNKISHVFLGETHVGWGDLGPHDNPWLDCSWKPIDEVFKATDQLMLFELHSL